MQIKGVRPDIMHGGDALHATPGKPGYANRNELRASLVVVSAALGSIGKNDPNYRLLDTGRLLLSYGRAPI